MKLKSSSGFTIIEVLITLGIGTIIVMIILLAVPSLRQAARNEERRRIVLQVYAVVLEYASAHGGRFPLADTSSSSPNKWVHFYINYISGNIKDTDPSTGISIFGDPVGWEGGPDPALDDGESCSESGPQLSVGESCTYKEWDIGSPVLLPVGHAQVYFNAHCKDSEPVSDGDNDSNPDSAKNFVIVLGMEPAGSYYCAGN